MRNYSKKKAIFLGVKQKNKYNSLILYLDYNKCLKKRYYFQLFFFYKL
jgi:hypothetical protein